MRSEPQGFSNIPKNSRFNSIMYLVSLFKLEINLFLTLSSTFKILFFS